MKRALVLGIVLVLVTSACSNSESTDTTASIDSSSTSIDSSSTTIKSDNGTEPTVAPLEPAVVRLAHDKPPWEASFEIVYQLAKEATGVEVDATSYSDGDAYQAFIRQSFRTDETPDLFSWWTGGRLVDLVAEGVVAPTTKIWADAIAAGDVSADLAKSFTVDGEQYCVPLFSAYSVIYYSKAAFDRIGAEPPTTWEEFIDINDRLVAEGIVAIMAQESIFSYIWFQSLLAGSDPDLYLAVTSGEAPWTDPGVVGVMELWRDMYEAGYFTPAGSFSPDELGPGFKSGDIAMINFPTWWNGFMRGQELSDDEYGVFFLPAVDSDLEATPVVVESGPLCAPSDSEAAQAAADYMAWYMTTEAQTAWAGAQGDVSFNPNAESSDAVLAPIGSEIGGGGYLLADNLFSASPAAVSAAANSAFEVFIADPKTDIGSLLEDVERQAADYWAEQG